MMTTKTVFNKAATETVKAMANVPGFTVRQYKMTIGESDCFQIIAMYMDEFSVISFNSLILMDQVDGIKLEKEGE